MRAPSACTGTRTRNRRVRMAGASFARSFDPCASILTRCEAPKAFRGEAFDPVSRLGKPTRVGGTSTGAGRNGRCAARRVSPLPRGRGVATSEKEGGRGLRPCEGYESRFGCSHVVFQLQKSAGDAWPRIRSAYALQKERSGSSERGPSSERRSAGHTVGGSIERNRRRASDSPGPLGEDRRRAQGGARASSSGHDIAQKRCSGRGTGAVKATGSYEGLPVDGRHPGSSRGASVTRSAHG
jgi:hypothetical protein